SGLVPLALVCAGVAIRRAAPGWCLALGAVGFGAELVVGLSLATVCVFTDNLYSYTRYGPRDRTRVLLAGTGAAIVVFSVWAAMEGNGAGAVLSAAAVAAVILVSPIGTGVIVRQAHDRASLEAERAEQTARLADARHREAVLRE